MLIVISPAKKLDYESDAPKHRVTEPRYLEKSESLIKILKKKTPSDLKAMMGISENLAKLNHERYLKWNRINDRTNSKPAIYAFMGDVYSGLDAKNLEPEDVKFAQAHLRILSGLYGLLKPLDLIQAYRLEMGTKLNTKLGNTLYDFWEKVPTSGLNQQAQKINTQYIVNLASNEYFKVIQKDALIPEILTPVFKEKKDGKYKIVSFYAKKARGLMAQHIIKNRITSPEEIKTFSAAGYKYHPGLSAEKEYVFTRDQQ